MKKIIRASVSAVVTTAIGFVTTVMGQSTVNYLPTATTVITGTNASLALDMNSNAIDMTTGATSIHGASVDDAAGTLTNFNLGSGSTFEFYLMGTRYTQFSAGSNGMIRLGASISSSAYNIPQSTNPVVAPFSSDLKTGTDGSVRAKVVGTAPNRCLVVEYFNMMLLYGGTNAAGTGTFQARFYEGTGVIEFVYGAMVRNANVPTTSTVTIGFSTNTTANNVVTINSATNAANTTATVTTNTYAASSTITDLNSAADGSRKFYRFIPPVPNAPTAMNFTGVTAATMTVNWTDASNELKYALYRSDDGETTYNFVSPLLGQDVVTSGSQTGLTPGVTYSWRVFSVSEGALSAALTGSQATTAAAIYYYVGAATGSDFSTAASWNTAADGTGSTRTTPLATDILIVDGIGTANTAGGITLSMAASQSLGALQITNNTALNIESSTTTTRTLTLTGSAGDELSVPSGSALILNNATQAAAIAFSTGTAMTGNIAGTLTFGGSTSNTLTTTGGTGTMVTVAGTGIVNLGAPGNSLVGSAATLVFANGSNCNSSGATTGAPPVPLATWGATSNLTVTGITSSSSTPTNNAQSFGNFTYNCPSASGTMSWFTSSTVTIQGNLIITATGTGKFRCVTTGSLTVQGNMQVNGSSICDISSSSGTVTVNGTFTHASSGTTTIGLGAAGTLVAASVQISAGTVDLSSSSSNGTIRCSGTFNQTGGTITESSTSTGSLIEFNGTIAQSVTLGTLTNTINYRINNNAGINLTGTMAITTGAGLRISSTAATPISGGTLTYTGTTTLTYDATGNQTATANEWPASGGPTNITINNTGTAGSANRVNLHASRTVGGTFTMTSGVFQLGDNDLTVSGTLSGTASNTNFVATNGTGQLLLIYSATGSKTFPLGDVTGTDEASAVTLNYTALTGTSTVGIKVTDAQHPNDASATDFLSRYYSFTQSGATAGTYTFTLNYPSGDITGMPGNTRLNRWDGSTWTKLTGTAGGATSITVSGLSYTTLNATADFTLRPATVTTYTWKGGSAGAWTTATNWNPTRSSIDASDVLQFDGSNIDGAGGTGNITANTLPATETFGQLILLNNANVTLSANSVSSALTINGGTGTDLDVPSGSTLVINGTTTLTASLAYANSGNTASIAGTLTLGSGAGTGVITYNCANAVTTVNGTLNNGTSAATGIGVISNSSTTALLINGTYNHTQNGGTIPTATYALASNVNITGVVATVPSVPSAIGGNFTWNSTAQTGTSLSLLSTLTSIGGNCTIQSTGTGSMQFGTSPTLAVTGLTTISGGTLLAAGGTLNFNGGLTISSGSIAALSLASTTTINVNGNYTQSGGTLTSATTSTSITLNVTGTFNQSAGTISQTSTGSIAINFNGAANQAVTLNGTNTTGIINWRVNNGNNNGITLTGTLPINNGASFTSSIGGTTLTGGTIVYNATASRLVYNSTSASQTAGLEWPSSGGPVSVTISNTGTAGSANRVDLHASRTVSGTFTMASGVFQLGNNDLTVSGTLSGTASNTNFIATNGTGQLLVVYSATGSKTFPVGDVTGTDEASAVTVNYTALTGTSTVGIKVTDAQHPNDASATDFLSRYYSFTQSGATAGTYTLTLNYPSSDITGSAGNIRLNRWDGSTWTKLTGTAGGATSATVAGLSYTTLNATADFTLRPTTTTTYTWKGGSTGAWTTATNWNPTRAAIDASDVLQFDGSNIDGVGGTGNIIANTLPATATFGQLILLNNANVNLSANSVSSTLTISGGIGTDLDVPSGSTLVLNGTSALTASLVYANSGNVASIAGTLTLGSGAGTGAITYNCANAVTTVDGTLNNGTSAAIGIGVISNASTTVLIINGTYNHAQNGGTIPTANYALASNVNVTGVFGTAPTPPATIGGNFTWNSTGQTGTSLSLLSILTTIGGNCTIQSTGTGSMQFGASPTLAVAGLTTISGGRLLAAGGTLNFNGGLTISSGSIATPLSAALPATINVNGDYTQSGGALTSATTSTSITLNVTGTFNQSAGTISHTSVGSMAINLTGSTTKNVTLNGTNTTGIINWTINNGNNNGINLTGTLPINAGASLTSSVGGTAVTGGTVTYTGTGALRYNAATNQTAGLEWPSANGPASVAIANTGTSPNNAVTAPGSRTISGTLTMTSGDLDLGANTLTLGTSTSVLGTLSYASGAIRVTTGSMTRWFGTSSLPTTTGGIGIGFYPLAFGTNNRSVNIYFSTATALTTGGTITVGHTDAIGTTSQNFLDGAYQVDKRTDASWSIAQTGLVASGTISIRLSVGGVVPLSVVSTSSTALRLIQDGAAAGTFVASSYSAPNYRVDRTGLSVAQMATTHYIGAGNADMPLVFTAVASGNWGDGTTWNANPATPGATDPVFIPSPYNVTVDGATTPYQGGNLTINSGATLTANANTLAITGTVTNAGTIEAGGGTVTVSSTLSNTGAMSVSGGAVTVSSTLTNSGSVTASGGTLSITGGAATGVTNAGTFTVSGGTVNLGITDNTFCNRTFTNSSGGALSVSSGTLNVYGRLLVNPLSTFNQSGGDINVDGNAGGNATNSVTSGTAIVDLNPSTLSSINLTGGTLTLVDPHANTTASNTLLLTGTSNGAINVTSAHTIRFGNGSSTDAGGNATNGFRVNTWASTTGMPFGNVIVTGPTGTNRFVTGAFQQPILGNLTINSGGEFAISSTYLNGNLLVNTGGIFTSTSGLNMTNSTFLDGSNITFSPSTNAQTIGGAGTFRNLAASPTANLTTLTINNSNASGVTLSGIDLSLSGVLTFTLGKINTDANKISLISGASVAGASTSTGWVNGNLQKVATVSTSFEIGSAAVYAPATVAFTGLSGTINLLGKATLGTIPTAGSPIVPNLKSNHYWTLTNNGGGGSFTSYTGAFTVANTTNGGTVSNYKVVKFDAPSTWSAASGSSAANVVTSGSYTSFSDFEVGEACQIPTLTLTAGAVPHASTCVGATSANLDYSGTTDSPDQYSIDYTDPSIMDVVNASLTASPIVLVLPNTLVAGDYTAQLTVRNSTLGCVSSVINFTVRINEGNTVGAASSSPTLCINTPLAPITHTTNGATGIGSPSGLPAGVNAAWASNTITINGTPTASGTFNYSIPLTGGCGSVNATGTITVSSGLLSFTTCPTSPIVSSNDLGICTAIVGYTVTASGTPTPTMTYTLSGATIGSGSGTGSGVTFGKGNTMVNVTASNMCGSQVCSFTVTVNDVQAPTVSCPANIIRSSDANVCSAVVTYATATATDNCSTPTVMQVSGPSSGSAFPVGTSSVTFLATDATGNSTSCVFTVMVIDVQTPNISCPSNISRNNGPGTCSALVTYANPTASDNCTLPPGQPIWVSGGTGHTSGSTNSSATFPKGATTVQWRATDAAGLTKTCTFRVVVNDIEAPILTCPSPINTNVGTGTCSTVVTYTNPPFTDNCSPLSGTSVRVSGLASGSAFPVGTSTVTFRATDAVGRSSTCSLQVIVTDTQPPTITCPSPITVTGSGTPCQTTVFYALATASDNCDGTLTAFLFSGLGSGSNFPAGVTTNTWRAIAPSNGQIAECSFTVTVNCPSAKPGPIASRSVESPLDLAIAPNPARTEVVFAIQNLDDAQGHLLLFDALGRLLWQQRIADGQTTGTLDVSAFADGLYQVSLRTNKGVVTKGLVVSKH